MFFSRRLSHRLSAPSRLNQTRRSEREGERDFRIPSSLALSSPFFSSDYHRLIIAIIIMIITKAGTPLVFSLTRAKSFRNGGRIYTYIYLYIYIYTYIHSGRRSALVLADDAARARRGFLIGAARSRAITFFLKRERERERGDGASRLRFARQSPAADVSRFPRIF